MERNLRNAFDLWMYEQHPDVHLIPEQQDVVEAFCEMSPACRTGKTFVLDMLAQFDRQTGSNVANLIPYFDRYDENVGEIDESRHVNWSPEKETEMPF